MHLHIGTTLQGGKYRITEVLGQGGFGITYLAIQSGLERKVAIKEFFMKELCERDESTSHVTLGTEGSRETVNRFREKFLKEARNIARLNHPNIVRIIDVFEENGTAYYVMEYAEGGSLADKVKREGNLSEPVATCYILQVAHALDYIHERKMNHLDVKPANIMLNEKDECVLIDFGLSKQYDAITGSQTSTTPVGISEGYAPMEQYMQGGVSEFSPETDIYALGATFYKLLTGITPPNASFVNNEGLPLDELKAKGVSNKAISVIAQAMEGRKRDRMKSVHTFIDGLDTTTTFTAHKSSLNDEDTLFTPEIQQIEAKAKATRERTEASTKSEEEARRAADDEARRKAEEEQKRKAEEQKRNTTKKSGSKNTWLWAVIAVIAVVGIIIGVNTNGDSSANGNSVQSTDANQSGNNASYSNGVLNVDGVTYDMVKVQAGTFTMGGTSELQKPTHQVTLTNDYYIGKTEVTQALWKAVMGNNPSFYKGENLPVEDVSWHDCHKFISKLNSLTGQNFRLPTEAEWEFAARGGNSSNHYQYSGSNKLGDVAWYDGNSGNKTHVVATKQPNELGIYDMSGNVWEWCSDWCGNYSSSSQTNPTGPNSGSLRVFRGGSCFDRAEASHSAYRSRHLPGYTLNDLGLRLVLVP